MRLLIDGNIILDIRFAIDAKTDAGILLTAYNSMDSQAQAKLLGYAEALCRDKEHDKAIYYLS